MSRPVALLDSCVMYKQGLRDLLMMLAIERLYAPRWSPDIHREWTENLSEDNPAVFNLDTLKARCVMLNNAFPGSLITGYEPLIENIILPDPKDRHVVAAATLGKVEVIITCNLTDFPNETLEAFKLRAQSPEDFMIDLFSQDAKAFCRGFKAQRLARRNPPRSVEERLQWLAAEHPNLARLLRDCADDL